MNNKTTLLVFAGGALCILAFLVLYISSAQNSKQVPPIDASPLGVLLDVNTAGQTSSASSTQEGAQVPYQNMNVIKDNGVDVWPQSISTHVEYVVKKEAPSLPTSLDTVYFSEDYLPFHAVEVGTIDSATGSYEKIPLSHGNNIKVDYLPDGNLFISNFSSASFDVWSHKEKKLIKHFEIPRNVNSRYYVVEAGPVFSLDGKMFAVSSSVQYVPGTDDPNSSVMSKENPPTLFIINMESGLISSYPIPWDNNAGGAVITGVEKWNKDYISFAGGAPKDCASWSDDTRFYINEKRFKKQNTHSIFGHVSPDGLSTIALGQNTKFPFMKNGNMCSGGGDSQITINSEGVPRKVFDKREDPTEVYSIQWVSDNLLSFVAATYGTSTTTLNYTSGEKIITDISDLRYEWNYIYDFYEDKLYELKTPEQFIAFLKERGYVVNKYTVTSFSYVAGGSSVSENYLEINKKLMRLPKTIAGGTMKFVPYNGFIYYSKNDPASKGIDCSKDREYCQNFYNDTRAIK